jgi:hypothetical protein
MSTSAIVNYHVHSDEPQAFHIDAGGEEGKMLSPELVSTPITVKDIRTGEVTVEFSRDSISFVEHVSQVEDFELAPSDWEETYNKELTELLRKELKAVEVIVFDHTVRVDDPDSGRKPARNVHSDYSPSGAEQRLKDILGEKRAADWADGHYGFVNVWRPVANPIESAPLGFIRPDSVKIEDWITIGLIYPDRLGQIMGLAANADHEWVYQSKMTPNEVAFFNIYDNQGLRSIGHSALDTPICSDSKVIRKSIESRIVIRYA